MADINVGAISEALNNKADRDFNNTDIQSRFDNKANTNLSNIPSAYDYVIASQEPTSANGSTWYRKYKSGWVEQGGNNLTGGAGITITFPITMQNSNYNVQVSQLNSDGKGVYFQCQYYDSSTTGLKILSQYGSSKTARKFSWQVSGYAA